MPQFLGNHDADEDVLGKASGSDDDEKSENDDDIQLQSQQLIAQRQPKDTLGRDNVDVARAANAEAALIGKNYEERLSDLVGIIVLSQRLAYQKMKPKICFVQRHVNPTIFSILIHCPKILTRFTKLYLLINS